MTGHLTAPGFSLRQLSYLIAAADEGTIAAASVALNVSASGISDSITELERILGVQLTVRRRAQGVTLTSSGQQIVEDARALLRAAQQMEGALSADAGDLAGPITIACYPTLSPIVLPVLLRDFGAAHPRIELEIVETTHDQLRGRIESGSVDVAFVYETLIPGNPRRAHLYGLPAHVLLAADHPRATADAVRLEDFVDEDLILLDSPPSSTHTLSMFTARGLTPKIRHRTSSYEAVRTLVARGLGYGVLVQRPQNPASYEGLPLVMKEITPGVQPVAVDVVWSSEIEPPARVIALIDFARSVAWPGSTR